MLAEVHVGQVEEARAALRIARISGLARVARAGRSRPCRSAGGRARIAASNTGVALRLVDRGALRFWNSCIATPATSSAMKCGTSHITGRSLRSASVHVAFDVDQPLQALGDAYHSRPRSSRLRPSQPKCSRTSARALAHRQLAASTARRCAARSRRREPASACSSAPERRGRAPPAAAAAASAAATAAPSSRRAPNVDRLHGAGARPAPATRARRLVAVVAPQVLLRALRGSGAPSRG